MPQPPCCSAMAFLTSPRHLFDTNSSIVYGHTIQAHLQVILPFEGLGADLTDIFSFVAVSQLVFGKGTGVVERLATDLAMDA